ncbi:MAG: SIMPL domain-containing protein [Deltaproteobacteria bacterium]|nr:SIMPL domain-containing protein [Deltaproteobacteria bacterium]
MKDLIKNIFNLANYMIIGTAVVLSAWIGSSAWKSAKIRPKERSIKVTGSAKRRIVSDLIGWTSSITVKNHDRTTAYKELSENRKKVLSWLQSRGVKEGDISVSSVSFREKFEKQYEGTGDTRIEKNVFIGYITSQNITLYSREVKKIEKISKEITSLLEQGITIESYAPQYYYTKIGELKLAMLAEASSDARLRATNIVSKADNTELGRLKKANMGVININPANSTNVSWDGNNDTTSYEKDIFTIVHAEYFLK